MYRALGVHEHKNNVREHFYCLKEMFELHKSKDQMTALVARADIDTVCAFEKYRMKDYAVAGPGLSFQEYNPEHYRGMKIPDLP